MNLDSVQSVRLPAVPAAELVGRPTETAVIDRPIQRPAFSRPLLALFVATVVLAFAALAGLVLDPRVITGAPAWLKPLKFAVSIAVYSVSFAWLLTHIHGRPRLVRRVGTLTAAMLAIELGLIILQAARGTTSHFNVQTPFDFAVFQVMAVAIVALWVAQMVTAVALLRQKFEDPALGRALRLGLAITVVGAGVGFLMTIPGPAQLALLQRGGKLLASGAHTVGGLDGGPGLPVTNWSVAHGDLRVPHFLGLHALQLLPLAAWLLRGLDSRRRTRLIVVTGSSYFALVVLLAWQALRGQPLTSPDAWTAAAFGLWIACTLAASAAAASRPRAGALEAA